MKIVEFVQAGHSDGIYYGPNGNKSGQYVPLEDVREITREAWDDAIQFACRAEAGHGRLPDFKEWFNQYMKENG